jgi:ubiquinone/menaquinone biosynthesis C-methylase UbiE
MPRVARMTWDSGYERWRVSPAHSLLIGEGYPKAIEPFSFVPFSALAAIAASLGLGSRQTLVDLGCGRGGIGQWIAQEIGTDLVGVDASWVAAADARSRVRQHRRTSEARFVVADAAHTGLVGACADALLCLDVLQLVPDPRAVAKECVRIRKPRGVLVLTTWEGRDGAPDRFPREIARMLDDAGLLDVEVTERPQWLRRQLDMYARAREMATTSDADDAVLDLAREAAEWENIHAAVRRISVTARVP